MISESLLQTRVWFLLFSVSFWKIESSSGPPVEGIPTLLKRPFPPQPLSCGRPPLPPQAPPPAAPTTTTGEPAFHPSQASRPTVPTQTPDPWREFPVPSACTFHDTRGSRLSRGWVFQAAWPGWRPRVGVGRGLAPHPGPCQYLVGLRGRGACLRCPGPHQVTTGVACVCHSVVQCCLGPSGLPDSPAPTGFALSARAKGPQGTRVEGGGAEGWKGGRGSGRR